jgi:radical S-adenosyl methionine domain-containing protein 2
MIITISGQAGNNKTEVARYLSRELKLKFYSIGELRKQMAKKRHMRLSELNKLGEKRNFTDKEVDDYQKELGKKETNLIVSGRLSNNFIPNSIKILLKAHLRIRADKTYNKEKRQERFRDIGDAIATLIEREKSDQKRYLKYYNIDCTSELQYDLIINTDNLNVEDTVNKILEFIQKEKIMAQ